MKIFKKWAVALVLFISSLAGYGQSHVPTTGSNNVWTGSNTFNGGIHLPALRQCTDPQVMAGFDAAFNPICVSVSGGGSGVLQLNTLTGNVGITNADSNLDISLQGQNIQINCPGCGGSGGSPGGPSGAIQQNISGAFVGTVVTGIVLGQGAGQPVKAAIPDVDFALPFVINCTGTGITCPEVNHVYTISLTGAAGSGSVAAANFGQMGSWASTGGTTTISGAQSLYALNPNWSLTQMNALFSRFNSVSITSWSLTSNVATFQGVNSYSVGDRPQLSGFSSGSFFNGNFETVTSATNAQFTVAFSHADASATETGSSTLVVPAVGAFSYGLVIIPTGMPENPSTAFINTAAQTLDWRKGYAFQQLSQYGVKCDAQHVQSVTLTAGSNSFNLGSTLDSTAAGKTMVVAQQIGFGITGTQEDWEPTITSYSPPTGTLSANAPFNFTGSVTIGTNNQIALTRAFKDVGSAFPLYLPTGCSILSDTVRWNGASLVGQQAQNAGITGFPGKDDLQQQDNIPITAWSINASTGVTTFTIPAYSAHSVIANNGSPNNVLGDTVTLLHFATSTFFNNQTVQIATQPTPTTITVNSAFGQSTSSGTESGLAGATTAANTNVMRVENQNFGVQNGLDGSFAWNHYDAQTAALTVEPPYYRPLQSFNQPMNNPFAPGWGQGQVNGVANITQNIAVICVSTASGSRQPVVGTTIVFPYQGDGLFSATVNSTAGSCSSGFDPYTLSASFPNNAAFTSAQAEWFTFTTPQTLAVSIPATITYPHTIQMALPFPPVPGWEANVSSHGSIWIGSDRFDYMGDTFGGTAGGNPTLVLRDGPTSINGGAGDAIGSVVFPGNPCSAMYNAPWPVVPTLNSGQATPLYAVYYAGICGANAALAFPESDGSNTTFAGSGMSLAYFNNVLATNTSVNSLGNANNNGSMWLYEQANNTGYGNTFDNVRVVGLWGGLMQGAAAVNQHGVRAIGPTSTGQTIKDCTFRTGYAISIVSMEQSNLDRCDTYSTETSPYTGISVGASTGLFIGYTLSEQDGGGITGVGQFTVKDYNSEPENGSHDEIPASVVSDGTNITWLGNIFEGGYNIFGGSYQHVIGTQMVGPVFNYGQSNWFDNMYGLTVGYNDSNVYNGSNSFWNWGSYTSCQVQTGVAGPLRVCGPGTIQTYNGHDAWATMMGDLVHPTENILGGMLSPDELSSGSLPVVFDNTELWWGKHSECSVGSGKQCIQASFDGFGGGIFIGPHQRVADTKVVIKANVKAKTSGTFTFRLLVSAQNALSLASCTPNFNLTNATFTVTSTGWTPIQLPVDFTGYASCSLGLQEDSGSATNVLEIGYLNIVPFPGQMYMPLGTPTLHAACPVAGEFKLDSGGEWVCTPTAGFAFGAGTWKYIPAT